MKKILADLGLRLAEIADSCPGFTDCPRQDIQLKLSCIVDKTHKIHALRCSQTFFGEEPSMRPLELAVVPSAPAGPISWQPISPALFNPFFPILVDEPGGLLAGVVASLTPSERVLLSRSFPALGVRLRGGTPSAPLVLRPNGVMRSFRMVSGTGQTILVLTTSWFPPPALPSAIALHLSEYSGSQSSRWLADPIPGTDTIGNNSTAVDLYLGDGNTVHVVYCGIQPGGTVREPHWYHILLGKAARPEFVHDYGLVLERPSFARLLADPGARIHALLFFPPGESGKPRYRLWELQGYAARPGPSEQFIVDPQLAVHGVRFDATGARYVGAAEPLCS